MSNSPFLSNCTAGAIREAAAALTAGHLVAFPTETVYGLGADARNPNAVRRIYEVKGRPSNHPLIIHISSMNQLEKWASEVPDYAISLARAFWPGPMTLILKRSALVGNFITGDQDTVGLRVPSDPLALALISEFEKISDSAIAAPSANRFGQVSPTSSLDVLDELGDHLSNLDVILDGGTSVVGIESTIIDASGNEPVVLRPGAVTIEMINDELELALEYTASMREVRFSGSLTHHYAPKAKVILDVHPAVGQGLVALNKFETPQGVVRLESPADLTEYAQCIYRAMRKADKIGLNEVVFIQPSQNGIGVGIRERLQKSAKGRVPEKPISEKLD
jgi:L-threonylcarbamoyladenylate synthase